MDRLSRAFAALADPTRRDIVARLAVADTTVGQLAEQYPISLQAVSKHLRVLEDAGLVSRTRDAQRRPVHLETAAIPQLTDWLERYRRLAEERFGRLDDLLAGFPQPGVQPDRPHAAQNEHDQTPDRTAASDDNRGDGS